MSCIDKTKDTKGIPRDDKSSDEDFKDEMNPFLSKNYYSLNWTTKVKEWWYVKGLL